MVACARFRNTAASEGKTALTARRRASMESGHRRGTSNTTATAHVTTVPPARTPHSTPRVAQAVRSAQHVASRGRPTDSSSPRIPMGDVRRPRLAQSQPQTTTTTPLHQRRCPDWTYPPQSELPGAATPRPRTRPPRHGPWWRARKTTPAGSWPQPAPTTPHPAATHARATHNWRHTRTRLRQSATRRTPHTPAHPTHARTHARAPVAAVLAARPCRAWLPYHPTPSQSTRQAAQAPRTASMPPSRVPGSPTRPATSRTPTRTRVQGAAARTAWRRTARR